MKILILYGRSHLFYDSTIWGGEQTVFTWPLHPVSENLRKVQEVICSKNLCNSCWNRPAFFILQSPPKLVNWSDTSLKFCVKFCWTLLLSCFIVISIMFRHGMEPSPAWNLPLHVGSVPILNHSTSSVWTDDIICTCFLKNWGVDRKIFVEKLFVLTNWTMFLQICSKMCCQVLYQTSCKNQNGNTLVEWLKPSLVLSYAVQSKDTLA
jgi:hypothetical protein